MSKRPLLFSSVLASTLALSFSFASVALAQQAPPTPQANPHCPPGSWFCADTQQPSAAPAGQPLQFQQLPGNQEAPPPPPPPPPSPRLIQGPPPPHTTYIYGAGSPPPPVVIYQPPPPVLVYQGPRYIQAPPPPVYYYRPRRAIPKSEWGLNLHVEGAAFGQSSTARHDSGEGGVGVGLRYKPIPAFALEADVDFLGGRDYNGFQHDETDITLNGMVFLNPRSRTQVYLQGGFGWAGAHVVDDSGQFNVAKDYSYFGGQGGIGLEFRLARHFALNLDALAFIRERVDAGASSDPEFVNAQTGQTSNTSGGVLFRGGMTFYF